jgi:AcrR family transcriptional regulator
VSSPPSTSPPGAWSQPARREEPYPVAARALLQDTLLDAARYELEHRGWSEITMADIATRAGVSRQTLYNAFGSREAFAVALTLREADRFLTAVEAALDAHLREPEQALQDALGLFLEAAGEDPLIRSAITGTGEMLPLVTTEGKPLVERSAQRLAAAISSRWPQASEHDVGLLSECLVRLAISYATLPSGPSAATAERVSELLGPFIQRALNSAP